MTTLYQFQVETSFDSPKSRGDMDGRARRSEGRFLRQREVRDGECIFYLPLKKVGEDEDFFKYTQTVIIRVNDTRQNYFDIARWNWVNYWGQMGVFNWNIDSSIRTEVGDIP